MSDDTDTGDSNRRGGFRLWMAMPALGAVALVLGFYLRMNDPDRELLPSALIDRPAPEFALEGLAGTPGLSTADLRTGEPSLVNVWASWCVPCRAEHPWIEALAEEGITVHGINQKDKRENAEAFLAELGNPYTRIGADTSGRVSIDWGVYGVPETFVLDGEGRIVYKHIGPINPGDISGKIRPALEEARRRTAGDAAAGN